MIVFIRYSLSQRYNFFKPILAHCYYIVTILKGIPQMPDRSQFTPLSSCPLPFSHIITPCLSNFMTASVTWRYFHVLYTYYFFNKMKISLLSVTTYKHKNKTQLCCLECVKRSLVILFSHSKRMDLFEYVGSATYLWHFYSLTTAIYEYHINIFSHFLLCMSPFHNIYKIHNKCLYPKCQKPCREISQSIFLL